MARAGRRRIRRRRRKGRKRRIRMSAGKSHGELLIQENRMMLNPFAGGSCAQRFK